MWHVAPTLQDAKTLYTRVMGSSTPVQRRTVADAVEAWLQGYVENARNERGRRLARQRAENHLKPALGMRPLWLVTAEDLRAYRIALERTGLAPQTVAHILSDARCLFGWAVDAGWLSVSPFPRRLLPRVQERPPKRLADDEVAKLIAIAEPWGFALRFLLGTGVRWGEAARAEAAHVERGQLVVSITKSGRVRRVPLAPALAAEIRGRVGRLMPCRIAQTLAIRARDLSKVRRFHVHMTRHTFACRWLDAGSSVETLQEVLGHSSIRTTQRYGRPSEGAVRREAERSWG